MKREIQKFFVPSNPVVAAQEFQVVVDIEPDKEMKRKFAIEALEVLGNPKDIAGSNEILIKAKEAMVLYDPYQDSSASFIYHGLTFDDFIAKAYFRFGYLDYENESIGKSLGSLCLQLFDTKILSCSNQPLFKDQIISDGVIVPVREVESVWPAR